MASGMVAGAGDRDRLAVVQALDLGHLVRVRLHQLGQAPEQLAAPMASCRPRRRSRTRDGRRQPLGRRRRHPPRPLRCSAAWSRGRKRQATAGAQAFMSLIHRLNGGSPTLHAPQQLWVQTGNLCQVPVWIQLYPPAYLSRYGSTESKTSAPPSQERPQALRSGLFRRRVQGVGHGVPGSWRQNLHREDERRQQQAHAVGENQRPLAEQKAVGEPQREPNHGNPVHTNRDALGLPSFDDLPCLGSEARRRGSGGKPPDH